MEASDFWKATGKFATYLNEVHKIKPDDRVLHCGEKSIRAVCYSIV